MLALGVAILSGGLAACGTTGQGASAQAAWEPTKPVFQVSDDNPRTWNLALNNVRNLQSVLGKDKVVACENTVDAQKLTRNDMMMGIGFVPAGVVEIIGSR